ncbi:TPA: heme anaerobic degradation radical SAM methyltransferase ChuW/HutW [Vibrio cholerae]|uniref:heme anaerobic degradation radical SAM methyltransferase ChuW/HutW n=1 Tax=Vibrio cholerae TaxID=666 RepID=UPI0004E3DA08|nr:heme anaerobic degradation radical SAM methyltransferase ChuW/HutW [Vibrio cholerae]KFD85950.1 putative heme utilization radical SAM enzyme HutW [Vibrio cholerae]MDV2309749.1 heme anaerobic degradation radical SAM methyltransferase ChuW/HutW [Vibrio cholerae]CAB1252416.1 coproporphyrinogen III oxidase [Vibrio cholerae]GHY68939.1 oxygen-independent coproporphyrinogen III oxidase, putative [Vibrio cholerae]GHZ52896.1 oxygen-independent coproporphyrinogen III oxidase, putative [Vibrio cholerae
MLILDNFDESILGANTPDPLRFAFQNKHSAHAGGIAMPVPSHEQANVWQHITKQVSQRQQVRCLYIHVPFCRVRCTFCNFFQNAASRQLVDAYFAALLEEIKQKSALPWTQTGVFHAVYIGGGTPTELSPEQIRQLGTAIRESFPLTPDCEITLEGRIHRFSDEMFENALEGGFNRFSFGVQSFNTQVRRRAKRLDDREVVMERIASLAATQQAPIVIDLLYGLPYQTAQVFEQDLQDFMQTGAQGIDLYQLVVGGSAPMLNLVEKGKLSPPATTPDKATLYQIGVEFMAKHHLRPLSVNHWTRDNRERSLYNSLAKTYAEVLPIGCGAGGNMGGYSLMQHRQLDTYLDAMKNGQPLVAMMARQHEYEPLFAALKAGFDSGVIAKQRLPKFYQHQTFDWLKPLFLRWQQIGLVEVEQDYLTLTTAGRFWSVSLAQACIQVLIHSYKYQQQRIA